MQGTERKNRLGGIALTGLLLFALVALFAAEPQAARYRSNRYSRRHYSSNKPKITDPKIQKKLDDLKNSLQTAVNLESDIMGQIRAIDEVLEKSNQELDDARLRLQRARTQERLLTNRLKKEEKGYGRQLDVVGARLVNFHKNGRVGYLEVILGATTMDDFVGRVYYLRTIMKNDRLLLMNMKRQKDAIVRHRDDIKDTEAELKAFTLDVADRQKDIERERERREYMLKRVMGEKDYYLASIKELEAESHAITGFIQTLDYTAIQFTGPVTYTGRLMIPTQGRFSSGFGGRYHPILHTARMHTGVDIAAPHGSPIVAADSGTVIFAGTKRGYGNTVIIQHSKDMSTLYAHGSRIATQVGVKVKRGELIMYVGSTGMSTGNHCHFEVRINGNPVNPMSYF